MKYYCNIIIWMAMEKSKVLIQFFVIFRQFGDVLFFLYARRLRGYTATVFELGGWICVLKQANCNCSFKNRNHNVVFFYSCEWNQFICRSMDLEVLLDSISLLVLNFWKKVSFLGFNQKRSSLSQRKVFRTQIKSAQETAEYCIESHIPAEFRSFHETSVSPPFCSKLPGIFILFVRLRTFIVDKFQTAIWSV